MRAAVALREAFWSAWATKIPSALVALLTATMVAVTLSTVGRTAAAEQQLEERLDVAGSRFLRIRDLKNSGLLSSSIISQSAALSVSERTVGIRGAIDVVNGPVGPGGNRVPAWGIVGDISAVAELTAGRWPAAGEAIVSSGAVERLGMTSSFGWVQEAAPQPEPFNVVGAFSVKPPFDEFKDGILINAGSAPALTLAMIISSANAVPAAQQAVLGLIKPGQLSDLGVESPASLAELRAQVVGDLAGFGRALLIGVLLAGAVLCAMVVLADVLVRRADLGRRRALGATRGTLVALVTLRTALSAFLGAALGALIGWRLAAALGGDPPAQFVAGVAVLAFLVTTTSAIPPALYAATRDPVRVLRTP